MQMTRLRPSQTVRGTGGGSDLDACDYVRGRRSAGGGAKEEEDEEDEGLQQAACCVLAAAAVVPAQE
jgi:hypothetical protein